MLLLSLERESFSSNLPYIGAGLPTDHQGEAVGESNGEG